MHLDDERYTTTKVAKICKISARTISRLFDCGEIKGYLIPGTNHRRIPRKYLKEFMEKQEIPLRFLDEDPANRESTYTPFEAGKILKVSNQTVLKCFDSGKLKGFYVPHSRNRRIPYKTLIDFAREYNLLEQVADYFGCSAQDL